VYRKLGWGKYMKKMPIFFCITLLLTISLSGCQEQQAIVSNNLEKINFDSDVLVLVHRSFDIREKNGDIYFVEVELYFKNNLNKMINVTYRVDFCDKQDNIIYTKDFTIINLPANYQLRTPDVFTYEGNNVGRFNHVNLSIIKYDIVQ
jgi:uncharacterized protein YcfL